MYIETLNNQLDDIKNDLDKLINNADIIVNDYVDHNINAIIGNHLNDFYTIDGYIYDFKVISNYPDVKIYIQLFKGSEITSIRLTKFDRLLKLNKLKEINGLKKNK